MIASWTAAAINTWKSQGIQLNTGASETLITQIENEVGIQFPDDFKELYRQMNGFLDFDWTPTMFSLWPLDRIVDEYGQWGTQDFVGFCDYFICSHGLGFIKGQPGIFKEYGPSERTLIAQSFAEAIHLINIDADVIN